MLFPRKDYVCCNWTEEHRQQRWCDESWELASTTMHLTVRRSYQTFTQAVVFKWSEHWWKDSRTHARYQLPTETSEISQKRLKAKTLSQLEKTVWPNNKPVEESQRIPPAMQLRLLWLNHSTWNAKVKGATRCVFCAMKKCFIMKIIWRSAKVTWP